MEAQPTTTQDLESAIETILAAYDDPNREGLRETPSRVVKMYNELLTPKQLEFTKFAADGYNEMIVQSDIPFVSLCEHHMLPFLGSAHLAYIPKDNIVGISKLSRCVEYYARRLQIQEHMTDQIATRLIYELMPLGVGVVLKARHLCQEIRGVKKQNIWTITSSLKGVFIDKPEVRQEFLSLCHSQS